MRASGVGDRMLLLEQGFVSSEAGPKSDGP